MISLPQLVHRFVADLPDVQRVVLAVSGGVDSMVLLHSTVQADLPQPLLALHVNHQLSSDAAAWQSLVSDSCAKFAVECVAVAVQVNLDGKGLEEAARQARYQAIEDHLRPGDLVLMAHHQLDQLETFFLRLARGAGVRGLTGMAALRQWGSARLGRPFLSIDRGLIEDYARRHALAWVEDESNASTRFDRNFLRLQVVPTLRQRWPELPTQAGQTMAQLRESDQLLAEFADIDLQACKPRRERVGVSVDIGPMLTWSPSRRHNMMRHWLLLQGYRPPARKRLEELESLLTARQDQNPLVNWGDCELRRYRGRVYCLPGGWQIQPAPGYVCSAGGEVELGGSRLRWKPASPGLPPGNYRVVARQFAAHVQRAHPLERNHSQTLKKLLQEVGLEPWLRDQVPMILQNDRLVAVADLWIEKDAAIADGMVPTWSFGGFNAHESD